MNFYVWFFIEKNKKKGKKINMGANIFICCLSPQLELVQKCVPPPRLDENSINGFEAVK